MLDAVHSQVKRDHHVTIILLQYNSRERDKELTCFLTKIALFYAKICICAKNVLPLHPEINNLKILT